MKAGKLAGIAFGLFVSMAAFAADESVNNEQVASNSASQLLAEATGRSPAPAKALGTKRDDKAEKTDPCNIEQCVDLSGC